MKNIMKFVYAHALPCLAVSMFLASCCNDAPAPYGAVPSEAQVAWQQMETNMFVHFGPNTFTSAEWGDGTESADVFAPSDLDCRQWAATAKAAGMKGIILTAKHHDGFCLWPNPVSSHTVAQSSWMDGKGDVLKELSEACHEYGLKFGIYISPWDRNDPHYGTPEYNEVFRQTLENALGNYGTVFEQWFDGACGEGPDGKRQVYDWPLFYSTVYVMQPDAVIFSNVGPGCRWVGNEEGSAGRTCWGTMNIGELTPSSPIDCEILNTGEPGGEKWVAAETDVSIRPGWFWRESENGRVKSLQDLMKIYYESVGRNSLLLLNVPADKRGHIHEIDSTRLMEFRSVLDDIFSEDLSEGASIMADNVRCRKYSPDKMLDGKYDTYWATDDGCTTASFTVTLPEARMFNRVVLQEYIPLGQRVSEFSIEVLGEDGEWVKVADETTIGYKRIVLIPDVISEAVRVNISGAGASPVLNGFGLYMDHAYKPEYEAENAEGNIFDSSEPLLLDLGDVKEVEGFSYVPIYKGHGGCIITYDFLVSVDGSTWTKVFSDRMFDNVVNNPVRQDVAFREKVKARYLKLVPLRTSSDGTYGSAGFEAVM
ncbi:MAG: alpha-L-fucosidase [Bacteroidales bacterium]|nr:alpha-L-fucosidase [Bacteroides sp.]MCM1197616.1 alpha-L-fucosidase [Clostridium sp.]MCM1502359.1 alpha-L-fucosidase [Bacteroidales bacterium]